MTRATVDEVKRRREGGLERHGSPRWRRVRLAAAAVCALGVAAIAPATVLAAAPARLEGHFAVDGVITSTKGFGADHKGDRFTSSWAFAPQCGSGVCSTVTLTRNLVKGGTDTITLTGDGVSFRGTKTRNGVLFGHPSCHLKEIQQIDVTVTDGQTIGGTNRSTKISAKRSLTYKKTKCSRRQKVNLLSKTSYTGSRTDTPKPPQADFTFNPTSPTIADMTNTVEFLDSSSDDGYIVGSEWNFGDPGSPDNSASGGDVQHTYAAPGTYTVTHTVTDDDGLSSTVSHTVTVSAASAP